MSLNLSIRGLGLSGGRGGSVSSAIHVSASGDDGTGNGSVGAPYLTLATAAAALSANDTLRLNRGDTWRESLSGLPNGVTVTNYGSGNLPVITGADAVTGLVSTGTPGTEGAGELGDADFETGDISELVATVTNDSTPTASTTQKRSGTHSMRITSNGTDGRSMGAIFAGSDHGTGTRSYFFAVYIAQAGVKTNSQMRFFQLRDSATSRVYLSLRWDASRNVTTWDFNNNVGGAFLNNSSAITGWNWDAWNTVEVRLTTGVSGTCSVYLNGALQLTVSGDFSSTNLTTLDRMYVGNDAFGAGLSSGEFAYFDDLKISANTISAALNASGDPREWEATLNTDPSQLWVDGQRGERVANVADLDTYRQWHWASNTLTVYGNANIDEPVCEATVRTNVVSLGSAADVVIDGITVSDGQIGIEANSAPRLTVRNATVRRAFREGLRCSESTQRTSLTITDNTFEDCGKLGVGIGGRFSTGLTITGNTFNRCGTLVKGIMQPAGLNADEFRWTGALKNWGWGGDGWQGAALVEGNIVTGTQPVSWDFTHNTGDGLGLTSEKANGIWWDEVLNPTARHVIRNNIVSDVYSRGIYNEKCDDVDIDNNLVYDCASRQFTGAIEIQSNHFGYDVVLDEAAIIARVVGDNTITNNTAVGGWWSFAAQCSNTDCELNNTTVKNNIFIGANEASAEIYINSGAANNGTNGTGNTYTYNLLGPEGGGWVWGSTAYNTLAGFQGASSSAAANNIADTADFTDEAGADFSLQVGSGAIGAGDDSNDLGADLSALP